METTKLPRRLDLKLGIGRGFVVTLTLTDKKTGARLDITRAVYGIATDPPVEKASAISGSGVTIPETGVVRIEVFGGETNGKKPGDVAHDAAIELQDGGRRDLLVGTLTLEERVSKL